MWGEPAPLSVVEELRARLAEAEETLRAIHSGEVDALVVDSDSGVQVFTLKGAEEPYRILVERMQEGAATLTADGAIVYANRRLAQMLRRPLEQVTGALLRDFVAPHQRSRFDELLRTADVLSLHCPLTPATTGMIGRRELSLMKPDALLLNTARGALVDLEALAEALRAGDLGGAAIDVLPQEPPAGGSPLFAPGIPNLIVTPHIAWAAFEARQRAVDELALNVADFLRGGNRGRVV